MDTDWNTVFGNILSTTFLSRGYKQPFGERKKKIKWNKKGVELLSLHLQCVISFFSGRNSPQSSERGGTAVFCSTRTVTFSVPLSWPDPAVSQPNHPQRKPQVRTTQDWPQWVPVLRNRKEWDGSAQHWGLWQTVWFNTQFGFWKLQTSVFALYLNVWNNFSWNRY